MSFDRNVKFKTGKWWYLPFQKKLIHFDQEMPMEWKIQNIKILFEIIYLFIFWPQFDLNFKCHPNGYSEDRCVSLIYYCNCASFTLIAKEKTSLLKVCNMICICVCIHRPVRYQWISIDNNWFKPPSKLNKTKIKSTTQLFIIIFELNFLYL